MERLARRRTVFKTVMVSSLIVGSFGLVGTVVFSLLVLYLPLAFCILLLGNALYGTVFYYIGASNADALIRALEKINDGERQISLIAAAMHRTEPAAEVLLSVAIKRGYVTGFTIRDGELCESIETAERLTKT